MRRKSIRQTVAGVILGLLLAYVFGLLLYFLSLQGRLS
jgi:high-affinity Fe2+/Pb2+ permease